MSIWVPPKVEKEMAEQSRLGSRAVLWQMLDFDDPVCKQWQPALSKLDPYVKLARAKPMAYMPGFTVRPGYYHFVRDNPGAPPTIGAITGPNDEWIEPDSGLLRKLQENDLQRPGAVRERLERERQLEREREREKEREVAQWTEEAVDRWNAGNRTFISMDTSVPWTQSAKAKGK